MSKSVKFTLKVILIIIAIGVLAFLFQMGKFYYEIKTGKIVNNPFYKKFTAAKTVPKVQNEYLNANELMGTNAPEFGSSSPELTIIEFASYACPHSKEAFSSTRELMIKYKDKVKFIYREFPIDEIYPDSSVLALMSGCANEQNKFWQLHDKLYTSGSSDTSAIITALGLNKTKFTSCVQNQTYLNSVQQDLLDGLKNGVRGTPTFFFIKKGQEEKPIMIEGAIPKNTLDTIITKALEA